MSIEKLNNDFAIAGQLEFVKGQGFFPVARIENARARALVSIYAGQVLSYQRTDDTHDLLFVSEAAYYQAGKAIKGGIPICWPWFGPDPEERGRAAHGFVRNRSWSVRATEAREDGATCITLGLEDSEETRAVWPAEFDLSLVVTVGDTLKVDLCTSNKGQEPLTITQALHSYFNVGPIEEVQVIGLDGRAYLDKAGDGGLHTQAGAIRFDREVDRIYPDVPQELFIEDSALDRRIGIKSTGSRSSVVWNPWAQISANMGDLRDDDYRRFVCVETANAAEDVIEIKAGDRHCLGAEFSLTSLSR